MTLSTFAIVLGLGFGLPHAWGLIQPKSYGTALRKFPRCTPAGYLLVAISLGWFLWNLKHEPISDFEAYKRFMYMFFTAIAVGTCFFVRDFLAVRGLALVLLLMGKLMVDNARWAESDWRWVISAWAYVWVVAGMWLTISPWRLRDFIDWTTATERRIRITSGLRLALGLLVAGLGMTVFRV